jgi:hypothetical protein
MMTAKLFRLIVQVGDGPQAAEFYAQLLGYGGRTVGGGRVYFDCGGVILALLAAGGATKPLPEPVYLAVGDLAACHARARALGALAKHEVHGASAGEIVTRPWGERSFYACDPWGNELCFVDENTVFTGAR